MDRLPGPLCQNAFIVADIEAAIAHWTGTLGIGPFFKFPPLEFTEGTLHGKPHLPRFKAAVAYSGDLIIELIEPEGPSIFQEYLEAGGQGVHHNCVMTDDLDSLVSALHAKGGETVQTQATADGSVMAYVQMPAPEPVIIEVAQLTEGPRELFKAIRAAAARWDGKTPCITF